MHPHYVPRLIEHQIPKALKRGKSLLVLGPRQTGKTTLVKQCCQPDMAYSLLDAATRRRFEQDPSILMQEIKAEIFTRNISKPLIVFIDEIQKIPVLLDVVQLQIDENVAHFILTGSSARKLRRETNNLLPGRVVSLRLDPFTYTEMGEYNLSINQQLLFGSLPGIVDAPDDESRQIDLFSYVDTYLEEEIRAESMVRNIGPFAQFLHLAASEAGTLVNMTGISQQLGIPRQRIVSYFEILEDCLIAEKILPLTQSKRRQRLTKAPKYLFFDLGVRRICAKEGVNLPNKTMGHLFEQWVGLELIRKTRQTLNGENVLYWRDHDGPEVDYVLTQRNQYIPIEVKWTENPTKNDARHLQTFLQEYDNADKGFIVCRTPRKQLIADQIIALPWQELDLISSESSVKTESIYFPSR